MSFHAKITSSLDKGSVVDCITSLSHLTCSVEHLYEETESFEVCMERAPSVHGQQDSMDGAHCMRSCRNLKRMLY